MYKLIVNKKLKKTSLFIVFRKIFRCNIKNKKNKNTMLIKNISIILWSDSNPCASEK